MVANCRDSWGNSDDWCSFLISCDRHGGWGNDGDLHYSFLISWESSYGGLVVQVMVLIYYITV